MSLRRLFKNFCTIVSIENAPVDSEGAIERDYHWTLVPDYTNIRCAIQGISRKDAVEIYGKKEGVPLFKIYHSQRSLFITPKYGVLTYTDPLFQITNFDDRENIVFYQYVGIRDPVMHKKASKVPLEFIVEQTHRWEF